MRTLVFRRHHNCLIHLLSFLVVADALEIVKNRSDLPAKCPPFQCGEGGVLIEYPFSPPMGLLGSNYSDDYYCGYQDLSVSCSGDTPRFNTSTDSYVVKAINYTSQTMTLVDADVLKDNCPKVENPWNKSYTDILVLSPSDVQLEFFFDCTPQEQFAPNLVVCLTQKIGSGASYVFPVTNVSIHHETRSILSKACRGGSVTSTVLSERWDGIEGNVSRFGSVLQQGFELTLKKTIQRDCAVCEKSNGSCGYVNETGLLEFRCYCKDGRVDSTDCTNKSSQKNILVIAFLPAVFGFLIVTAVIFMYWKKGKGKYLENIYEEKPIIANDSRLFEPKTTEIATQNFLESNKIGRGEKEKYTRNGYAIKLEDEPMIANDSLLFEPKTIELATQNFSESNKIGQGGFGSVYKGIIPAMKQEIAVKLLCSNSHQGIEELRNEVSLLVKLKHKNLVQLLGFCVGGQEKCLIYEYVNNQSLDKFLSDPVKKVQLVWQKRYNIIKGIAKGLLYLHEESHVKIIHRDLKASNVLLDSDLNPKIADFGLARMIDLDHTKDITRRIAGTFGYMSPEYVTCGHFSTKSDVFSFGVLLLEIIMGRKSSNFYHDSNESTNLLSFVWENWQKRAISTIVDSSLGTNYAMDEALTCIQIGLLCVQESPNDRITMATVVRLLLNCPISINAPSRPAFLLDGENKFSDLFSNGVGVEFDQNELSITELESR